MVRYLLDLMPEFEQRRFEADLLTNNHLSEELQIVEDELIDDYLNDQLADGCRTSFEAYLMSSENCRTRLSFALSFHAYLNSLNATEGQQQGCGWWQTLRSLLRRRRM